MRYGLFDCLKKGINKLTDLILEKGDVDVSVESGVV